MGSPVPVQGSYGLGTPRVAILEGNQQTDRSRDALMSEVWERSFSARHEWESQEIAPSRSVVLGNLRRRSACLYHSACKGRDAGPLAPAGVALYRSQ